MKFMKPALALALLFFGTIGAFAQSDSSRVLATIKGKPYTEQQLPSESKKRYDEIKKAMADRRLELLEMMVISKLIDLETAERKITGDQLYQKEIASKIPEPSEEDIKTLYEAAKTRLGNKPLSEVRDQVVRALKQRETQNLQIEFIGSLKAKYKVESVKNVNTPGLNPQDVLVTMGVNQITFGEFNSANSGELFEAEEAVFLLEKAELDRALLLTLAEFEALEKGMSSTAFLASEVTDKMKQFSDEERNALEDSLRGRLYPKYDVKIAIAGPVAQSVPVSADDDPFMGPANARVTMIMFTDFQCPACARMEPVLKSIAAEFKDSVKFVVRDFPLESIHPNAFNAALAANAAGKQGKFFEYGSILYQNQNKLDSNSLRIYAQNLGLDMEKFQADFSNPEAPAEIRKDLADGMSLKISGTPTIFINGVRLRDFSADGIRNRIKKELGN